MSISELAHQPGNVSVALPLGIDEPLDRALQSSAYIAAVVGACGYRGDIEARAVMLIEHAS